MTSTHVGMRCPDCAKQKTKVVRPRSMAGGEPRATYAIIAINVVAFIVQAFSAGSGEARSGAVYTNGVLFEPFVSDGEWWRLVTSAFLHEDPIHLLLNMVLLFILGQMLEQVFGVGRFVAVYVAALFAGSLGVVLLGSFDATIGASGAVYGLLGAAVVYMRDRGINPFQTWVGAILILGVLWTFGRPNVSVGGHLGGLAGGALAALVLLYGLQQRSRLIALGGPIGVAVVAALAAVALSQPS